MMKMTSQRTCLILLQRIILQNRLITLLFPATAHGSTTTVFTVLRRDICQNFSTTRTEARLRKSICLTETS